MKREFANICRKIYNILHNDSFKETYRMQDKDFTRNRKLGFGDLCMMILRGSKNGLQAGINEFLKEVNSETQSYSNAAFCKARQKISPDAFKHLTDVTVQEYYNNARNIRLYKGYRVFAIDGSDFNLPNTESLFEVFGSEKYQEKIQVQAQVSCMYDVLNNFIVDARMEPFNTSERVLAEKHLQSFSFHVPGKDLVLMDRGYPSEDLLKSLENQGYKYVLRTNKAEFFREVRKVTESDAIIQRECRDKTILKIRVVTVQLDNGVVETLLTNLFDVNLMPKDFAEIYRLRWSIETAYGRLKNQFRIEDFTGVTPISVMQDFHATIFLANLLTFLEDECKKELEEINNDEDLKYQYKINSALAISTLKKNVVELLMTSSKRSFVKEMKRIRSDLLKCLIPVRPGRHFDRVKKHRSLRYPQNNKLS